MTSKQKSSKGRRAGATFGGVESLAGAFHPHAIEVQDFAHYGLIVDVRSLEEFEADHIPRAVRVEPTASSSSSRERTAATLPEEVETHLELGESVLVYCGRGGADSQPLAEVLRARGCTVDVLPGGWINYRRWVQAGVEVLPRLIPFRIVSTALGSEGSRALRALRTAGQQVLDLEGLAAWRFGSLRSEPAQPSQAMFESRLLHALRGLDPGSPVWVTDVGSRLGSLTMPMALQDALAIAPTALLQATLSERVRRWHEDEPALGKGAEAVIRTVADLHHADPELLAQWNALSETGTFDPLLASILSDCFDAMQEARQADRSSRRIALPPVKTDSLAPRALLAAVRTWLSSSTGWRHEISS